MRFRHPYSRNVCTLEELAHNCLNPAVECESCVLAERLKATHQDCKGYILDHPREVAALFELEVLLDPEDNETEPSKVLSEPDMVNTPPHYTQGGIECAAALDAMVSSYPDSNAAALAWQVGKYVWRHPHKAKPLEDLKKARWYLNRLIDHIEKKESMNDC